jgi:hypothetical protein
MNAYLKWLISLSIVWVLFAACEKAKEILTIDFTYNNSNPLPELPGGGGGSCLIPPGVPSYNSLVNSATGMNFVDVPFGYTLAMQGIWEYKSAKLAINTITGDTAEIYLFDDNCKLKNAGDECDRKEAYDPDGCLYCPMGGTCCKFDQVSNSLVLCCRIAGN